MFIKLTGSKNNQYLQIVQSYRQDGKVKHKVLLNLGRLDVLRNTPGMMNFVKRLNDLLNTNLVEVTDLTEATVVNWGWKVYREIWDRYELDRILNNVKPKKLEFEIRDVCFYMAIEHLLEPKSKLKMYNGQGRYMEIGQELGINHLYRGLDVLSSNKERIEEEIFRGSRDLFNNSVDVVFYDCTTFYFESNKRDGFREYGYSKEGRINHVQVVLGLMIDMEGMPVGYEVFEGNTFEGKTLELAIEKLRCRFGIRKVIVVADRGLMSKANIERLKEKNYGYVIASRIKSQGQAFKEEVLRESGYRELNEDIKYKEMEVEGGRRVVVYHSQKRAKRDYEERQRLIDKAEKLIKKPSMIDSAGKRGGRRYIKASGEVQYEIDMEAIERDEQYDGYFAIETSEELSAEEILGTYKGLWKIEESFRVMKSTLEVRPIFHWTERRIRGHFMMCFIAFLMQRALEIEIKKTGSSISSERIKRAINEMNYTEIEVEGKKVYIRTKLSEDAKVILKSVSMKIPSNILTPNKD